MRGCAKLPAQRLPEYDVPDIQKDSTRFGTNNNNDQRSFVLRRRRIPSPLTQPPAVVVKATVSSRRHASTPLLWLTALSTIFCGGCLPGTIVEAFSFDSLMSTTSTSEMYQLTQRMRSVRVFHSPSPSALRASRNEDSNDKNDADDGGGEASADNKKKNGGGGGKRKGNEAARRNKQGGRNGGDSGGVGAASEKSRKKPRRRYPGGGFRNITNSTSASSSSSRRIGPKQSSKKRGPQPNNLSKRVAQLEGIVAGQSVEIRKLRQECRDLREAAVAFSQVVELLRQAGLATDNYEDAITSTNAEAPKNNEGCGAQTTSFLSAESSSCGESGSSNKDLSGMAYDYYEDEEIFGSAPASVIDAADAAGAAILAALLAGKQRMLVDVRDAELSRDPDILVQFIELAVLPVAAGLEGIEGLRNRVKIVFPTVSQLLQYRRTMALAGSTEVVTLSTLGFDPVQDQDSLVFIIAPSPDDDEGIEAMNELLSPADPEGPQISQPVVVLNHHMVPVTGVASNFSVAYHLRLLSVQYMTGDMTPEYMQFLENEKKERKEKCEDEKTENGNNKNNKDVEKESENEGEEALEAAMNRARELGVHHGITRAMVIRAYPRPWHVFVDTSPDSDTDFEVAATFNKEPSQDDVNYAIVECLEGSETEDELVAQQMQAALESGQLNRVSEMLDVSPNVEIEDGDGNGSKCIDTNSSKTGDGGFVDDEDDDDDLYYDDFGLAEDSC